MLTSRDSEMKIAGFRSLSFFQRLKINLYRSVTKGLSSLVSLVALRDSPDWKWRGWLGVQYLAPEQKSQRLVWLHAASAGELEILWGIAKEIRESEQLKDSQLVLTVFSSSGRTRISEFKQCFKPIYCGPSPWEGSWGDFVSELERLHGFSPSVFITAKYEAWPELWGELALRSVPILMVNAQARSSLSAAIRWTRLIFGRLPQIWFSCVSEKIAKELGRVLVGSSEWSQIKHEEHFESHCTGIRVSGDPRWDQVSNRLSRSSPRVQEIHSLATKCGLPKPWVIVGSAWQEDLENLLAASRIIGFRGSFWFVPHRPSAEQARAWLRRSAELGVTQILATGPLANRVELEGFPQFKGTLEDQSAGGLSLEGSSPAVIFVQELGILAELYSIGQAAWVGGGFRTGLHSVIEPALNSLWIGAGAPCAVDFPEVRELRELGQLELVENSQGAAQWLARISQGVAPDLHQAWSRWRVEHHLGASRRISSWVAEIVSASSAV